MNRRSIMFFGGILLLGAMFAGPLLRRSFTHPTTIANARPEEARRCPVCGMFVERYHDWMCRIQFADGHLVCFDGVKDLFKYYFDIRRYDPQRAVDQISFLQVTDYYSVSMIDGYQSHYVIGSDVLGPMGHELIPFATEKAALEFLHDHHGKRVVIFADVTTDMLSQLE